MHAHTFENTHACTHVFTRVASHFTYSHEKPSVLPACVYAHMPIYGPMMVIEFSPPSLPCRMSKLFRHPLLDNKQLSDETRKLLGRCCIDGTTRVREAARQSNAWSKVEEQELQLADGAQVISFKSGSLALGSTPTSLPPPLSSTFHDFANRAHGLWACVPCAKKRANDLAAAEAAAAAAPPPLEQSAFAVRVATAPEGESSATTSAAVELPVSLQQPPSQMPPPPQQQLLQGQQQQQQQQPPEQQQVLLHTRLTRAALQQHPPLAAACTLRSTPGLRATASAQCTAWRRSAPSTSSASLEASTPATSAAPPVPCFGAGGGKAAGHTRAVGRMDSGSKGNSSSTQG